MNANDRGSWAGNADYDVTGAVSSVENTTIGTEAELADHLGDYIVPPSSSTPLRLAPLELLCRDD